MRASNSTVRPLLKWAGGKRQLLPILANYYPQKFSRYIEPFMGSAAVFFDLLNTGRLARRTIILADVNPDLIGCYRTLRDRPEDVNLLASRLLEEWCAACGCGPRTFTQSALALLSALAWPGNLAVVDRIAHGDVAETGRAYVANGRDACQQRPLRVRGALQRHSRHR